MSPELSYAVTGLGILLCLFCFAVVFRGQRIPGDEGSAQELEFKGLKLKANSLVTLLIVSALLAGFPLGLQAWIQINTPAATPTAPATAPQPATLRLFVTGQVLDGNGGQIENATVRVFDVRQGRQIHEAQTDGFGSFDFPPLELGQDDRYKVVMSKDGFLEQTVLMGPGGSVGFNAALVKRKTPGTPP
ncbi:MAG: carboxypeptidase-like regulatory domain-containing protein [Leptothrix ochracea]|uniref:carboxypeptidase-like regulatory domain-containing protein n=1 Tax=Leptothrix ochracea TaxID=735331 RepID=UPI0034E21FC4